MANETIVVVEDEDDILELISYNLRREGFLVRGFDNGEDAVRSMASAMPDGAVLDLMLPGIDGLEACRRLRSLPGGAGVSVIMLTAKGEESDIVRGLEIGADDYIVKPFSPRVLIARMRAQLRRKRIVPPADVSSSELPLSIADISIHPGMRTVTVAKKPVKMTASEFKALHYLASRPDWVFSRSQIVEAVHGENYPVTDRSVDVLIVGLRRKLGSSGMLIETVRGTGYTFRSPEHA